jgi:hypothetical protein
MLTDKLSLRKDSSLGGDIIKSFGEDGFHNFSFRLNPNDAHYGALKDHSDHSSYWHNVITGNPEKVTLYVEVRINDIEFFKKKFKSKNTSSTQNQLAKFLSGRIACKGSSGFAFNPAGISNILSVKADNFKEFYQIDKNPPNYMKKLWDKLYPENERLPDIESLNEMPLEDYMNKYELSLEDIRMALLQIQHVVNTFHKIETGESNSIPKFINDKYNWFSNLGRGEIYAKIPTAVEEELLEEEYEEDEYNEEPAY